MNRRRNTKAAAAALCILLLILDSRCALNSARQAIDLCIRSVIPSLFPFLFLSAMITDSIWGTGGKLLQAMGRAVQLPAGTEALFPAGFLGGYPAGAAALAGLWKEEKLSKQGAEYLLCFCSNAGPAFLFGMVAMQFPEIWMTWCIWGIHILSAALVGRILPCPRIFSNISEAKDENTGTILPKTIRIMAMICGWILLFRVLLGFLDRWCLWLLPQGLRVMVWGLLELSNGCCALGEIGNISIRFVAAAGMISFGGLCVMLQTASVLSGLSMKPYLCGKLLQTGFSLLLAAAVMQGWSVPVFSICLLVLFLPKRRKKSSSNLKVSIV